MHDDTALNCLTINWCVAFSHDAQLCQWAEARGAPPPTARVLGMHSLALLLWGSAAPTGTPGLGDCEAMMHVVWRPTLCLIP